VVELLGINIPEAAKGVAFATRAKSPERTVFIGATVDPSGKPLLTVMITEDLVKEGLNASTTVREAAKLIQGGGGGQPGFAQAGGKNKDGVTAAYEKIKSILGF
jgi:alanyl-tRNA synthetase